MPDKLPDVEPGERLTASYVNALRDAAAHEYVFHPPLAAMKAGKHKTIVRLTGGGVSNPGYLRLYPAVTSGVVTARTTGAWGSGNVDLLDPSAAAPGTVLGTVSVRSNYKNGGNSIGSGVCCEVGWDGQYYWLIGADC